MNRTTIEQGIVDATTGLLTTLGKATSVIWTEAGGLIIVLVLFAAISIWIRGSGRKVEASVSAIIHHLNRG